MKDVDKSGLPGRFKAWIFQHGVLPRILWPLMLYEIPMSTVENMERIISWHLRRWLGVPRSFTSIGLYSTSAKLSLPLRSLSEEFKVTKVRQDITLRTSQVEKVREAGVTVRS